MRSVVSQIFGGATDADCEAVKAKAHKVREPADVKAGA